MTARIRLLGLFFLSGWLLSGPLIGQLEVYPYVGIVSGADNFWNVEPDDALTRYTHQGGYAVGVDVLVGARRLAPLIGLVYQTNRYDSPRGELDYNRALLPLGVAYRLRHPNTSFNLIASAAGVAGRVLDTDDELVDTIREGIQWNLRGGLVLTLDFITLSAHYYRGLSNGTGLENTQNDTFVLGLGGRF